MAGDVAYIFTDQGVSHNLTRTILFAALFAVFRSLSCVWCIHTHNA